MSDVNGAVVVEGTGDAAVIVHDDVGILPLAPEFDRRAVIRIQVSEEMGVVVHVQRNVLSVGVEADAAAHASTQLHVKNLATGRAKVCGPTDAGTGTDTAPRVTRLEADIDNVASAPGVHNSPAMPVGKNVKMPAKEKSPGPDDSGDDYGHNQTERHEQKQLRDASQAGL